MLFKLRQANCEKHGLNFEDAELIFASKTITFQDDRENYGEEKRFWCQA
jgi:uncharacterized DUF497 family protein